MGYSYDSRTGNLCCDGCDAYHDVRKVRCPVNWCQAAALCPACRAGKYRGYGTKAGMPEFHPTCAAASAAYHAREATKRALLEAGAYIRCSALAVDRPEGRRVHVVFQNGSGQEIAFTMTHEAYDALPILAPLQPSDFRAIPGVDAKMEPAPVDHDQVVKIPYQPKTGVKCSCKPGVYRDNCPTCEGTGWVIDFAAIRRATAGR